MHLLNTVEIAVIGGMQARESRELCVAAEAAGLPVRPLRFGSPLVDTAIAAHGPGSVQLPLVIVDGRYCLQRPAFETVLECIEVLQGTRHALPEGCIELSALEVRRSVRWLAPAPH
jgi:hypothetical protein